MGRVSIAPPRETTDRVALPARRTAGAPLRFGLPLIVADWLAALVSTVVLSGQQRDAFLIVQLVVFVTVLNAHAGLYRYRVAQAALDQLPVLAARIAVSWLAAAAALAAFFPQHAMDLTVVLSGGAVQLTVACSCRSLVHLRRRVVARNRRRSALVVGTGQAAGRLALILSQHPEYGLRPVGIAAPVQDGAGGSREGSAESARDGSGKEARALPVLTTTEEIHRAVIQNGVQEAVFTDSGDSGDRSGLVALFHEYGCATWFVGAGPWDVAAPPAGMAEHLWGFTCRRSEPPAVRRRGTAAKRLLDILITGPALLTVSPVLLACALAVRLCDGPGVLFRQERVGQNGRPFTLLKFRTLRAGDLEAATRWNVAGDHRMSAVGSLLRRTSMDELPQLWNVLRGDMSLVGPRPERPFFVANFSKTHPGYSNRHRMPVGITGLAQVHGLRGDTSIEDRSRFDNHYIDHWSLWQDVCILLRTAASLVRPAGS
jgi:exopolysaccharide biosynthesis polyprenyl glycosylphosphotransferase